MKVRKFGFTITEILLAIGLFTFVAGGAVGAVVQAYSLNRLGEEESIAHSWALEGLEAARAIAAQDFVNLSNGSHGLTTQNGIWEFSGTSEGLGKFTRKIIISNVYRDALGNIVPSGGTLDLLSKRVEALVTWNFSPGRSNSASLKTYFTNSLVAICNWKGSVIQAGGLDLAGTGDAQDIDVVGDKAYVTTMRNPPGSGEFFVLDITVPVNPTLLGKLKIGDHTRAVAVSGNYAYLATSLSGEELIVVSVVDPASPVKAAVFDIPGVSQANDVVISGNYAFVVTENSTTTGEFYIFNISNPFSPTLVGSFDVGNHVYGVYVGGQRAYLANARADRELLVLDVSNPILPVELGGYDAPLAGAPGQSVFAGGGIAHLTTRANGGGIPEYYLLDASDPAAITLIGSFDVSARANGVETGVGFSILATEKAGEELMIIDTADPSNPAKIFSLDLGAPAFGVALKDCFAYFASGADGQEIKVVTPTP